VPWDWPADRRTLLYGAECCVWTELLTHRDIDRMLFPRILIAIAIGIEFLPASTVRVAVRVDRRCFLAVNESGDESGSR
jgi:hypothetical protein